MSNTGPLYELFIPLAQLIKNKLKLRCGQRQAPFSVTIKFDGHKRLELVRSQLVSTRTTRVDEIKKHGITSTHRVRSSKSKSHIGHTQEENIPLKTCITLNQG